MKKTATAYARINPINGYISGRKHKTLLLGAVLDLWK
jgi:hypothetical protein